MGESTVLNGKDTPKVSVTVVTYNHGDWLAECLESIVSQETDFSFEVVVGDDASTDGRTTEVLEEYSKKYPEIIIPIFRKKNIGPIANYFDVVRRSKGRYIAHVDGDDVMLSKKLQIQADFLDNNLDFVMAVHEMFSLSEKYTSEFAVNDSLPEVGDVYDLLRCGCYFSHSSKMYRSDAILTREAKLPVVDYFLHIEHAMRGKIFYDKNIFGGHRLHTQGMSSNSLFSKYIHIAYDRAYDRALELGLKKTLVERGRIRHYQAVALSGLASGDLSTFRSFAHLDESMLPFASFKQRVVHLLSANPTAAFTVYRILKKWGT